MNQKTTEIEINDLISYEDIDQEVDNMLKECIDSKED